MRRITLVFLTVVSLTSSQLRAQDAPAGKEVADERREIIGVYRRALDELARDRIVKMTRLAARQKGVDADLTYRDLFQFAIATEQYRTAEPAAEQLIKSGPHGHDVEFLAHLVNVIAEADRGAFDESMASLRAYLDSEGPRSTQIRSQVLLTIGEAYLHRLVRANRPDLAKALCQLVIARAQEPAIKAHFESSLKRVELIGRPAPPIEGADADGAAIRLSDLKGKLVLVSFWATWCPPCAEQIPVFAATVEEYGKKGFAILGVDVDTSPDPSKGAESVRPLVRRYLLDHIVTWPTVFNGTGDRDFAKAYAVDEIPANILIGPDGRVATIDIRTSEVDSAVAKALSKP